MGKHRKNNLQKHGNKKGKKQQGTSEQSQVQANLQSDDKSEFKTTNPETPRDNEEDKQQAGGADNAELLSSAETGEVVDLKMIKSLIEMIRIEPGNENVDKAAGDRKNAASGSSNSEMYAKERKKYLNDEAVACCNKGSKGCSHCSIRWYPEEKAFTAKSDLVPNFRNKKKDECILNHIDWTLIPQFHRLALFKKMGVPPCECARCKDVTEDGTLYQGLRCEDCHRSGKEGYALPVDPYGKKQVKEWACIQCKRIYDVNQIKLFYSTLDEQLSLGDENPIEKLICLMAYKEKGPLHRQHFIYLKGLAQVLLKVVEQNMLTEVFFDQIVDKEIDEFRGLLNKAAADFTKLIKLLFGNKYCNYFTVQERLANAVMLLKAVYSVRQKTMSVSDVNTIVSTLYFRDVSNPLISKPLSRICGEEGRIGLRKFENAVIKLIANSLKDQFDCSNIRTKEHSSLMRLFIANGVQL